MTVSNTSNANCNCTANIEQFIFMPQTSNPNRLKFTITAKDFRERQPDALPGAWDGNNSSQDAVIHCVEYNEFLQSNRTITFVFHELDGSPICGVYRKLVNGVSMGYQTFESVVSFNWDPNEPEFSDFTIEFGPLEVTVNGKTYTHPDPKVIISTDPSAQPAQFDCGGACS